MSTLSDPDPDQPSIPSALAVPLTGWLSYLMRQVTLRVQHRVTDALAEHGMRPPHNAVLSMLADGPLAQITLATQLQTDRTTMVAIIDDLEVWQLVERRRNQHDRRAHDVNLTELGRARLIEAQNAVSTADTAFFATLTESERAQLRAMLLRLIAVHDASQQEANEHKNSHSPRPGSQ